jgi:hypothetical protein
MPTAEVLASTQTRFDYESAGGGKLYVPSGKMLLGAQGGAMMGIEVGLDEVGSLGLVYNAKWRVIHDGLIMPAIAIGVQGLNSAVAAQDYVVATKSLLPTSLLSMSGLHLGARASAGLLRQNGRTAVMYGAGVYLGSFSLKADHVNGDVRDVNNVDRDGSALSIGWKFTQNIKVTGTRYFYLHQPDENTLGISFLFKP